MEGLAGLWDYEQQQDDPLVPQGRLSISTEDMLAVRCLAVVTARRLLTSSANPLKCVATQDLPLDAFDVGSSSSIRAPALLSVPIEEGGSGGQQQQEVRGS